MDKPRLLLIEDDSQLRADYGLSLANYFQVIESSDGEDLETIVQNNNLSVILGDSDLDNCENGIKGYKIIAQALAKSIINDSVLIIGMSGDGENERNWAGIAHYNGFYNKLQFETLDIGKTIAGCLHNFRYGGLWAERMPCFENTE